MKNLQAKQFSSKADVDALMAKIATRAMLAWKLGQVQALVADERAMSVAEIGRAA